MNGMVIGVGVVAWLAASPTWATAEPDSTPQIKVSHASGKKTVTLTVDRLRVSQRVSRSTFALTIAEGADVIHFSGDTAGLVVVQRAGQTVRFGLRTATPADVTAASSLLAASPALARFERFVESPWAKSTRGAAVFVSAHAMLSAVQGRASGVQRIVRSMSSGTATGIRRVDSPEGCWNTYQADVIGYTYQLEACLADASNSWNPLATAWCAYEYDLKAMLAFMWLLDCSGVGLL